LFCYCINIKYIKKKVNTLFNKNIINKFDNKLIQ
jgi:hypothetical protein